MVATPNYGWVMPDPTDFVTNLPADFEIFGDAVDASVKALNPGTTAGDIDYYTSATAKTRLALGTANQVLAVNSGGTAPQWTTIASGGQVLLESGTLTGASVTTGTISGAYNDLILVIRQFRPATDNSRLAIRFNGDTANNFGFMKSNDTGEGVVSSSAFMDFGQGNDNAAGSDKSLIAITIPDYTNTSTWKIAHCTGVMLNATTPANANLLMYLGYWDAAPAAITSITMLTNSGNINGSYRLYGVR